MALTRSRDENYLSSLWDCPVTDKIIKIKKNKKKL
jgi:hypothetical protein